MNEIAKPESDAIMPDPFAGPNLAAHVRHCEAVSAKADHPAVLRLTEALGRWQELSAESYRILKEDYVGEAEWRTDRTRWDAARDLAEEARERLLAMTCNDLPALLASHAALTDRLARAEADGMRKAAKLLCVECRNGVDTMLIEGEHYHWLGLRPWFCRATAIHAALASAPPPEGT
jgi:hypothetical protein